MSASSSPPSFSAEIHNFPLLDQPTTQEQALALLRPHLPASLPLYRRIQSGRFFPDTRLLTNLTTLSRQPATGDGPWILAFLDRTVRPETDLFLFGSWESQTTFCDDDDDEEAEGGKARGDRRRGRLLLELAATVKGLPLPTSIHQHVLDDMAKQRDRLGEYAGHALNANIVLCGAVHERTVPILESVGLTSREVSHAKLVPNRLYMFDLDEGVPPAKDLPEGFTWGELREDFFDLVRSRTQIPRQDKTMAVLPRLAVFAQGRKEPVAWAFLGLDGSLTTLHVEAEWRGKGVAKAVAIKLFRERMGHLWEKGQKRLAYANVIEGNQASCGVCESLGGRVEWEVYWVRMDLGRLE